MASKKQRKNRARRARQHTTEAPSSRREGDAARAEMEAYLTDARLLEWALGEGVDLTDRDQLLDSAAVGLTVIGRRNTELENEHAGADPSADQAEAWRQRRARVTAGLQRLTTVADDQEVERFRLLLEARAEGDGIPDDVMLRLNAATAASVRAVLAQTVPAEATVAGTEVEVDPDSELPTYLAATYDCSPLPTGR